MKILHRRGAQGCYFGAEEGPDMYYASVLLLTLILPAGSVYAEQALAHSVLPLMLLIGKWFAFRAGGVRLLVAGIRQQLQPRTTAQEIFGIMSDDPLVFIEELGMANAAMGVIGVVAVFVPAFILPAAIVSGLYYAQAGIGHLRHGGRNPQRNLAMISDLLVAILLLAYVLWALISYL
jgi:hypothetical protein